MDVEELLNDPTRYQYASMPESDALVEIDSLQEADLVDVRLEASKSLLAMIFDLRTALQFRLANTAVIAFRGVHNLNWNSTESQGTRHVAHYVMSSKPMIMTTGIALELVCLNGWSLKVEAASAEFFVGSMPKLPDAQPNFVEDDEEVILRGMPDWNSQFLPEWATFVNNPDEVLGT